MNQNLCIDYNTLMSNASIWISNFPWNHIDTHYNDVIMSAMASQIISVSVVYLIVWSGADQRNHQSSLSLVFVRGIHRWPVNSPHKGPVTRKMLPLDDVTIGHHVESSILIEYHFYAKNSFMLIEKMLQSFYIGWNASLCACITFMKRNVQISNKH